MDNLHAAAARKRGGSTAARDFQPHVVHDWDPHGWRTMAKLAAKPVSKWGGVELGLYMLGSHDVVGIPECRVHHPSVNRVVDLLQASAKKVGCACVLFLYCGREKMKLTLSNSSGLPLRMPPLFSRGAALLSLVGFDAALMEKISLRGARSW